MQILYKVLLLLHITTGTIALVAAPVAIALRNKTPKHRIAGRFYFYSMLIVVATALFISVYKGLPFLFLVAIFSFYAIWDARRSLELKMLHKGQNPKWYDWAVGIVTFLFDMGLVGYGINGILQGKGMGIVAIVFGSIGLITVGGGLYRFIKRPVKPNHWLYRHIIGMIGGYIATVTAFLTNNIHFLPRPVVWLGPTVIGSVVITYFIVTLKRKERLHQNLT